MIPDNPELRRALDARSGDLAPEFRGRLHDALAAGRPATSWMPALALAVVFLLSVASVGILLASRNAARPSHGPPGPTPTQLLQPVAGILVTPSPPIELPTYVNLSARSSYIVWALVQGAYLYRSVDGGNTWSQRPVPPGDFPNPEISFIDDQEGWFATGGEPATQCSFAGETIWHTSDAGSTWEQVAFIDGQHESPSGIANAQCKGGLSFVDPDHGFLSAWDDNHRPTIYRTSDAGVTWSPSTLPDPPGFVSTDAGFVLRAGIVRQLDGDLLVPASGMQEGDQSARTYVFRSVDGGASWTFVAAAPSVANDIVLVTAPRWLLLLPPDGSLETTDSGKSWHPYLSDYSQAAGVAPQVVFGDAVFGYATVRGSIQRTRDGGLHWTYIKTPGVVQPG
jgi:photosystem II stability/assembly factor-like uncharacterized protein